MKNKKSIIWLIVLVVILAAAMVAYPRLKEAYDPAPSPTANAQDGSDVPEQAVETVPDFTVLDAEGNEVSLSDCFGKPLVINFWATWCGSCRSEMPAFDSAFAQYGEDVTFLMVNLTDGSRETVDGVKDFAQQNDFSFPIYFDTQLSAARAYGVRSIPMTVFVRSDGTLSDYTIGSLSEKTLLSYIEAMTNEAMTNEE